MHNIRLDIAALASCAVLLAACGDDGPAADPTGQITSATITATGQMTTTTAPGTTEPTTTVTPTDPGNSTVGTESGGTDTTGVPPESTGPGTTDTDATTTGGETTDPGTSTMTMPCEEANCPMGQLCDPNGDSCIPGCNDDTDCNLPTKCDVGSNTCKGCLGDGDCPLGTVCDAGECTPGCNDMQPCNDGLACCSNTCIDLLVDVANCQGCGNACPAPPNGNAACVMGQCGLASCKNPWNDCDKDPGNGCENQGPCQCDPGTQVACYTGQDGTQGVGVCKEGVQTCNPQGTGYGACDGEITPNPTEICSNNLDDNCNGQVDEDADKDGDGYTVCGGDCCDEIGPSCLNPVLVNPGAFEVGGNMVDDDCDGTKDNPVASCDGNGLASNSSTATDYAKAIDLCQFTTENPPQNMKKWGVISGTLTAANGVAAIDQQAKSIRPGFGTNVLPQQNARLAILSTGHAADSNDMSPNYSDFQQGTDNDGDSAAPADWLGANGGNFPNAPGCPAALSNGANDSAMLKLRIRVPTNAKSFNVQMYFYSAEWPEWTCTYYNDMFVTLVTSTAAGNPADKNIAIYKLNNQNYPVGVNLVKAANGLFTQCQNGEYGCADWFGGTYNGCTGVGGLAGTGFDIIEGGCENGDTTGGGTGWLKMSGNVTGGEIMEIRFAIWDTSDPAYDSLVLLDDWVWSVQASQPGVQPN